MLKSKIKGFILFLLAVLLGVLLVLYFLPIKRMVNLDDVDKYTQSIVVICHHSAVTGADWAVEKIIKGEEFDISKHINIKGDVPKIWVPDYGGSISCGHTKFLFAGNYIRDTETGDDELIVERWDLASKYMPDIHLVNIPKSYLNIFDYKILTD